MREGGGPPLDPPLNGLQLWFLKTCKPKSFFLKFIYNAWETYLFDMKLQVMISNFLRFVAHQVAHKEALPII